MVAQIRKVSPTKRVLNLFATVVHSCAVPKKQELRAIKSQPLQCEISYGGKGGSVGGGGARLVFSSRVIILVSEVISLLVQEIQLTVQEIRTHSAGLTAFTDKNKKKGCARL